MKEMLSKVLLLIVLVFSSNVSATNGYDVKAEKEGNIIRVYIPNTFDSKQLKDVNMEVLDKDGSVVIKSQLKLVLDTENEHSETLLWTSDNANIKNIRLIAYYKLILDKAYSGCVTEKTINLSSLFQKGS